MSDPATYANLISGTWRGASDGETYENRNPANDDEVVGVFPYSPVEDVDEAVAAALEAQDRWRRVPAPRRGEILFRAARMLEERKEEFAREMTREMGKVLEETRGDVQEAIDMGFYCAGEGRRLFGHTTPSEMPDKFQMSVRQPVGVVAVITPWNFPMAIASWKIFPALICGNAVVWKPATDTPLSAVNFVRTLQDAGVPDGVVNLVCGSGSVVGDRLVEHPDVTMVSFTGSTEVGRGINERAGAQLKHTCLEMGGKNPIIVMDDAELELALDGALWGGFGTTGQRCTAASRVILHDVVYDEFMERFADLARGLEIGDGLDEGVEMGPVINESQLDTILEYIDVGEREGAELVAGGERLDEGELGKGWFLQPTIFGEVDREMRIAREEIFGPVVSVLRCSSLEEAVEIANDVEYGLSSAIYTRDVNRAFWAMRELYTGITYVNAPTIGAEIHLPFGGTKGTGNGHREAGQAAIDVFSEWKSIYVDFSGSLQRAQIDRVD